MISIELEHQSETAIVQGARSADPGSPAPGTVWALARVEGRRLVLHPAFLAGCLITVAWFVVADLPNDLYLGLTGAGAAGPALGTLLAANAGELRSRTSGGEELLGSIPLGPESRTAGMLTSVLWPAVVTVALTAILGLTSGALDGAPVALVGRIVDRSPTLVEWLQGPVVVAFAGVFGVFLARLVQLRLVAVLVTVASGVLMIPMYFWGPSEGMLWLTPLVHHGEGFSWVQVNPGAGYSVLAGFQSGRLGWHLLYLAGFIAVLAGAALLRYGRRRGPLALTSVGLATAVVAGTLQLV